MSHDDEFFVGELAELQTTQTIASALGDIGNHIAAIVELLDGYSITDDESSYQGEVLLHGNDGLAAHVNVALRHAIAHRLLADLGGLL